MASVHIAITRRVCPGKEAEFESAIREFAQESLGFPGTTGVHLVGPVAGSDNEYGILRSFASEAACNAFYDSEMFAEWMDRTAPLAASDWVRRDLTGLEAFFRGRGTPPPRWKMALVTWVGVFPTVLIWSAVLAGPLAGAPTPLKTAISIALTVVTLTWGVMPLLTKALAGWLHR